VPVVEEVGAEVLRHDHSEAFPTGRSEAAVEVDACHGDGHGSHGEAVAEEEEACHVA
jgi:hypothetical protein